MVPCPAGEGGMADPSVGASLDRGLVFYRSTPHACGYLPGRTAASLFVDPDAPKTSTLYARMLQYGFRRSGDEIYRPQCGVCQACVPVRIPVQSFRPNRAQRRTWQHNLDLEVRAVRPTYRNEHFNLYRRYVSARHRGGGMDHANREAFLAFLTARWVETIFYEFRLSETLLTVAVVDRMGDALSAVYTFFEPDVPERSLGRYAILYEIAAARALGLDWLYLGYWVRDCRKMRYKNEFQPLEYYSEGRWKQRTETIAATSRL